MRRLTVQQVFDRVARHLLEQGKKSLTVAGSNPKNYTCLYRGPGGTKCAVGAIIPDELYCKEIDNLDEPAAVMPGGGVSDDSDGLLQQILWEAGVPADGYALLDKLQDVHDGYDVEQWPQQLREVAGRFGLKDGVVRG